MNAPQVNILLVDDQPEGLLALEAILASREYRVIKATSGELALLRLLEHDIAVIVLDVHMPGLDGFETARLIKERERSQHTPIIFLTGTALDRAFTGYAIGAVDYLMKPVHPVVFKSKIAVFAELHRQKERLAAWTDTLEQRVAERTEALRRAEEKYRSIFENAMEGIFQVAPDGRFITANPALASIYGYGSPEELITHLTEGSRQLYVDPDRHAEFIRLLEEQGRVSGFEVHAYRKDGREIWISTNARAVPDESGAPLYYEGTVEDITPRKQAEEKLRLQGTALESAANAIVITDREGQITWVNPAFTRLTGYPAEEVLGQTMRLLKSGQQDQSFYRNLWETILSGHVWQSEIINRRKDGGLYTGEQTITPVRDESGEINHFVSIHHDITERKRAEDALQAKTEEVRAMAQQLWQTAKLATMGELAASIAHELNNPLGTVSLRVESLLAQVPEDDSKWRLLEVIEQEVERMSHLVTNLLHFSRRSQPQISTLDVCQEIERTLELIHYHLRNRRITVVREFAPDVPMIQADRQQLRQLFLNLFTNASDAMAHGGTLTIRVFQKAAGGSSPPSADSLPPSVIIEIADTGVGIAPEDLPKVMEPFFTTKAEDKGTGLGLSICRRIVKELHGTVDIVSEVARGTTVRVVLPVMSRANETFLREE